MSVGLLCSTGSRPTSKAGMGTNGDGMGTAWGQKRNEGRTGLLLRRADVHLVGALGDLLEACFCVRIIAHFG